MSRPNLDEFYLGVIEQKCKVIRHLYTHKGCLGDHCPMLGQKLVAELRAAMTGDDNQELGPAANSIPYAEEVK